MSGAQETAGPWDTGLVGGAEVEEVGAAGPASGNGLAWLQVGHEAGQGGVRQQLARRGAEALHAPHELGLYLVAHGCSGRLTRGSKGSEGGCVGRGEQAGQVAKEEAVVFINSSRFFQLPSKPVSLLHCSQPQCTAASAIFAKPDQLWPPLCSEPSPASPQHLG